MTGAWTSQYLYVSFAGPSLTSGSLSDLELPDILHYHMIGGPRSAVAQKLKKAVGAAAVGSGGGGVAGIVGGGPGGGGGTGGGGGSAGYQGREVVTVLRRC